MSFSRAYENKVFFISCNRVGKEPVHYMGKSIIAHPFGKILAKGGDQEEVIRAALKYEDLHEERAFFPIYAKRRPEIYDALYNEY